MKPKVALIYVVFAFSLALSHSFFLATYQLFLKSKGINCLGMSFINTAYMVGIFIFQVPTGAFADCCGRKKSIITGCAIKVMSFSGYYFSNSLWQFAGMEMLGALGCSFIFGALESWVIDKLKSNDSQNTTELIAQGKTGDLVGFGIGSFLGAFLSPKNLALPWILSAISSFLIIPLFYFLMKENDFQRKKFNLRNSFKNVVEKSVSGVKYSFSNKKVIRLIIFGSIASACFMSLNMQWQGFFEAKNISVQYMGLIFLGISTSVLIGTQIARWWFKTRIITVRAVFLSQGITAVAIVLTTQYLGILPTISWFMVHEMGRGMLDTMKKSYLHDNIQSEHRTTIPSFESMVNSGSNILGLFIGAVLTTYYSVNTSWITSGIVLLITIILFLRINIKT